MKLQDLGYAVIGWLFTRPDEIELKKLLHKEMLFRVTEDRRKFERKQEDFKIKGTALQNVDASIAVATERCNHRKGGNGLNGIVKGTGDSNQFAVIKHRHLNGDTHVRCLRCSKTWRPGDVGYYNALDFQTHNVTSTDVLVASTLKDGKVTGEFAEAWRKWTNGNPLVSGVAFNTTVEISNGNEVSKALAKIEEIAKFKRPVTLRKEFIPTITVPEKTKEDNPQFNIFHNPQANVS